jgi:hypothetical protein
MRERTRWVPVVAALGFLGTSVAPPPVLARGGINTSMVGFRSGFATHTARPSMLHYFAISRPWMRIIPSGTGRKPFSFAVIATMLRGLYRKVTGRSRLNASQTC